jgi:hypothetical protein
MLSRTLVAAGDSEAKTDTRCPGSWFAVEKVDEPVCSDNP